MKLILDKSVEKFLEENNTITKEDLIDRMNELFKEYPKTYTLIRTDITKNDKTFRILYGTNINNKDIDCIDIQEETDNNITVREYLEKKKRNVKDTV